MVVAQDSAPEPKPKPGEAHLGIAGWGAGVLAVALIAFTAFMQDGSHLGMAITAVPGVPGAALLYVGINGMVVMPEKGVGSRY